MSKWFLLIVLVVVICLGCAGATGIDGIQSNSDVQKGCGYIAAAIVTHGALQIFFRE